MRVRSPELLWRYIGAELLRVLAICALVVVTVIAFAAAVRPLAEGRVEPFDALKLMGLLSVPMLQFALPFAAGLASTLAHHRFASENEAMASMAGGISHRSLLVPSVIVGLGLTLLMAVLTSVVIPEFFRRAEQLLTRDATRFIVAPIQRGEVVHIGPMDVHAEEVIRLPLRGPDDGPPGALDHLVLKRVLAVKTGAPEQHLAADLLDLWLLEPSGDTPSAAGSDDEQGTDALLRFTGATGYWPGSTLEQQSFTTARLRIPSAFHDDPKFLPMGELASLMSQPDRNSAVAARKRRLAGLLAQRDTIDDIRSQLQAGGSAVLRRGGDSLVLRASRIERDPTSPTAFIVLPAQNGAPIKIESRLSGGGQRFHDAKAVRLDFRASSPGEGDTITLSKGDQSERQSASAAMRVVLSNVSTYDTQRNIQDTQAEQLSYSGFSTQADHAAARDAQSSAALLQAVRDADPGAPADAPVARAAEDLRGRISLLSQEVLSKLHERAAYSLSCVLMVLCGAIIALNLRDALPLSVYLWSFFPALACVITISSGQRLTEKIGGSGLFLLWGGVIALAAYCLLAYRQLRRH